MGESYLEALLVEERTAVEHAAGEDIAPGDTQEGIGLDIQEGIAMEGESQGTLKGIEENIVGVDLASVDFLAEKIKVDSFLH